MKLKKIKLLSATGLLVAAGAVSAEEQALKLASETAVVLDADGTPLVRASRAYLLSWAENDKGQIFEVDPEHQRVRITRDARPALWLSCADVVQPACGSPQQGSVRTLPVPEEETVRGALPVCPGDPRCPK